MKKFILLIAMTFAMTGCTKEQVKEKICDSGKKVATLVTAEIAASLECMNQDAIQADIEARLVELKVCQEKPAEPQGFVSTKSAIGDALCKPVIEGIVAGLLTQVPAKWDCKGGSASEQLKTKLLEQCSKIL